MVCTLLVNLWFSEKVISTPTIDNNIYKVLFDSHTLSSLNFKQEREQGKHRDADIQVYCPYYRHTVYRYIVLITDILYTGILSLLPTNCIQVYCPYYRHTVYRYIVLITDILYTGILSSLLTSCIRYIVIITDILYTGILSSLLTYCVQVYCPHF